MEQVESAYKSNDREVKHSARQDKSGGQRKTAQCTRSSCVVRIYSGQFAPAKKKYRNALPTKRRASKDMSLPEPEDATDSQPATGS